MKISCNVGYSLKGSGHLKCLESGEWDNTVGSCIEVVCPSLNGTHFSVDSSTFGESKAIQCKTPLELTLAGKLVEGGGTYWKCGQDGEWVDTSGQNVNITHWDCIVTEIRQCSYPQVKKGLRSFTIVI